MKGKTNPKYHTVMLIDDNEIDNFIDEKLIKAFGFAEIVYVHSSAQSALEALKDMASVQTDLPEKLIPKYVFLDINMPFLDGFNFLDQYDLLPANLKETIKIVMLTSSVNPVDSERAGQYALVHKYFQKPLTENMLLQL
ncbi:MAG: response regulator [Bacteroidetes bacterium]|nr:response regulator [Bacteroidota bacterium]